MSKKTSRKVAFQQRGQMFLLNAGQEILLERLPSKRNVSLALAKKLCLRLTLQTEGEIYVKPIKVFFTAGDAYLNGEIINEGGRPTIAFQAVFYYSEEKGWIKV